MEKIIKISGLDCAHCAAELEEELIKLDGVSAASVSFVNQKIHLEYDTPQTLEQALDYINHFEEVKVVEEPEDGGRDESNAHTLKKEWVRIALSSLLFAAGVILETWGVGALWTIVSYVVYALAYILVGYPVLFATVKNIGKGKIFDENFLMTLASIGAVCIGEVGEAVMVMLLYQIGETLQALAVRSSRRSVSDLMELKSEWATVVVHHCACGMEHDHDCAPSQKRVRPEQIQIGDVLLVKSGEKIPVDGELISESAALDTKAMTGESALRKARKGEELLSGYVNAGGAFEMRATREYADSAVKRILDLVENAASGKAKPEKFITKFAKIYTPIVCILALALVVFAPLVSGLIVEHRLYFMDFTRWLQSALTFLVISCPCALIISVPLTYFSGIGACAKQGVLVKGSIHLDALACAKTLALDKTGTLTEGNFSVISVLPEPGITQEELLGFATALERLSSHPIAKAFEEYATNTAAQDVVERAGLGLVGKIDGKTALVGNEKLLDEYNIEYQKRDGAYTTAYVAVDGKYLGALYIGDKIRPQAKTALAELKSLGLRRAVVLTGDSKARAQEIANEVGVYEVNAQLLPDEKLKKAEELKKDGLLVYVGDGVNDAPVMAASDVAVSMGALGSAAAVEASDLVLVSDDLSALPKGLKIARKTRKIVMQNIVFSIAAKVAFMTLGVLGVLPLWLAVFADVGVMLVAVCNSLRVRIKND